MLRYDRQIKPGLFVLYDVEPGNGVLLFLQPRRPHGAINVGKVHFPHEGEVGIWPTADKSGQGQGSIFTVFLGTSFTDDP